MSIKIVTPNDSDVNSDISVFLAGSIEMGKARFWQEILVSKFVEMYSNRYSCVDLVFYNPYLKNWDNTINNTIQDERFNHQVSWEWKCLLKSDLVVFNFESETKSPISLLELGAMATLGKKIVICCPKEFWKYGNVEFISNYYNIPLVFDLDDVPDIIQVQLNKLL